MKERILTQHPNQKKGVNIQRDKYEQVRGVIESALKEDGPQSFQALNECDPPKNERQFRRLNQLVLHHRQTRSGSPWRDHLRTQVRPSHK